MEKVRGALKAAAYLVPQRSLQFPFAGVTVVAVPAFSSQNDSQTSAFELAALGRAHTPGQAQRAVAKLRSVNEPPFSAARSVQLMA